MGYLEEKKLPGSKPKCCVNCINSMLCKKLACPEPNQETKKHIGRSNKDPAPSVPIGHVAQALTRHTNSSI